MLRSGGRVPVRDVASSRPSWPVVLVGGALACGSALPTEPGTLTVLAVIVLLGVPHGALDGEVARGVLRPHLGRAWFAVFAPPYLALSALVLLSWHVAPVVTLALFLAASVWHFGSEDTGDGPWLEALVRGGLPIALPTLVQPAGTVALLGGIAGVSLPGVPIWLEVGSIVWLALVLTWAGALIRAGRGQVLAGPGLLACCFAVLPPLVAFAIYFTCMHAPAHTAALIADGSRGPRVRDARSAAVLALPLTGLTLLLGAALWHLYAGPPAVRLLTLTFQGLAALTLPHMLLDAALARYARARQAAPSAITPQDVSRLAVRVSPSQNRPSSAANTTLVSRSAETAPMASRRSAQITTP